MININKVFIGGNLTKAPELKFTASGTAVCNFDIATNRTYTKNGEQVKETEYTKVVVWNKAGENCGKFLVQGQNVVVEGRKQTRSYEKQDGTKGYITEIVADKVDFGAKPGNSQAAGPDIGDGENIPF